MGDYDLLEYWPGDCISQKSFCRNYTEEEKKLLKKFFRVLVREFHPDINQDSEKAMVLMNKLKVQWGL
ncbi:hypothetical protein [Bacillus cereus]|uniref:hypothetical protein n=1 Tax=Bacillus cereus TaxID=1396 RepID=UPI000279D15B|nr:hypothetical protein [Bacillus cereus]EJR93364.1 hypothetical protein IKG_05480 [Bacillus cereus VD200]